MLLLLLPHLWYIFFLKFPSHYGKKNTVKYQKLLHLLKTVIFVL